MTISSHLPDLVGAYIKARAQRLEADKLASHLKEQEELLKDAIISKYREGSITALGCDLGIVKMAHRIEPVATDWNLIWDHVKETGDFSLLHKRLTNAAVKEHWEAGEQIPGVGKQDVYQLSVSAAPTKQST
jgi:hypothetical protein